MIYTILSIAFGFLLAIISEEKFHKATGPGEAIIWLLSIAVGAAISITCGVHYFFQLGIFK